MIINLIVGFQCVSDLGKILVLPKFGELPQWAVVGKCICFEFKKYSIFPLIILIEKLISMLQVIHSLLDVLLMSPMFITRFLNLCLDL